MNDSFIIYMVQLNIEVKNLKNNYNKGITKTYLYYLFFKQF